VTALVPGQARHVVLIFVVGELNCVEDEGTQLAALPLLSHPRQGGALNTVWALNFQRALGERYICLACREKALDILLN
jgi:hypothetical protein